MGEIQFLREKVLGVIFILVGIGVMIYGYSQYSQAKQSQFWETVSGSIISSKIVSGKNSDNEVFYKPKIKYKYSIAGVTYRSDRIFFGDPLEQTSAAMPAKYVSMFPANAVVTVYYNPFNPAKSVLLPGETTYAKSTLILSTIFILIGVFILIYIMRKERNSELDTI
jgi:uncharacterized membrane protein YidH (DUF202 family)